MSLRDLRAKVAGWPSLCNRRLTLSRELQGSGRGAVVIPSVEDLMSLRRYASDYSIDIVGHSQDSFNVPHGGGRVDRSCGGLKALR